MSDNYRAGEPVLSIVIPVWNRAHLIGDCLASIRGDSDCDGWEVIVVDDGSTDGTPEAVRAAFVAAGLQDRARLIEQPNGGPGAARNTAVAHARGTWIACLDSDDLWLPWTLSTLLKILDDYPHMDAAFLKFDELEERSAAAGLIRAQSDLAQATDFAAMALAESWRMMFGSGAFVCRRSLFLRLGGFNTEMRNAEDTDLFLRLPLDARLLLVHAPVMVAYIRGTDSLTASYLKRHAGVEAMRARELAGVYPGGNRGHRPRSVLLARHLQDMITVGYQRGARAWSYGLFLKSVPYLIRNRCRLFILRYHQRIAADLWKRLLGVRA